MEITTAMLRAARRAEFDYYQRNREIGARFVPIPDGQMREILEAAIAAINEDEETGRQDVDEVPDDIELAPPMEPPTKTVIVRAKKPRPKR